MNKEECCVVSCNNPLGQEYWDAQYKVEATGWDLGIVSPPLKKYIDTLENKNIAILIPGCGNSYEAVYLLEKGFKNITLVDIAPTLVAILNQKLEYNTNIKVICGDFFEQEGKYDLIIEQTFFCALSPTFRQKYVWKMHQLLAENGLLSGLLFNRSFEVSPPFGGSKQEYENLFLPAFDCVELEVAKNSIAPRASSELFFQFKKNSTVKVNLYSINPVLNIDFTKILISEFLKIKEIFSASYSFDLSEILIVSAVEIPIQQLQELVAYDTNLQIKKL